jgi:hypothetical protein
MVNNQYGNLKFGAGEMALFCAKSLFRYHISVTKGIGDHGEQPVRQPQVLALFCAKSLFRYHISVI